MGGRQNENFLQVIRKFERMDTALRVRYMNGAPFLRAYSCSQNIGIANDANRISET